MRIISFAAVLVLLASLTFAADRPASSPARPPNIVLILADDLGIGDVGCYGQKVIETPNIDALARDGMRFTNAYSPSPVCAPTRCSLLTGLHLGHSFVRDNKEVKPEGQVPIPADTLTIAEVLKRRGYATACIGKWGLGPVGSEGDPLRQGFDFFYGHNCQRVAHSHYADHVWRNDQRVDLEGNPSTEQSKSGAAPTTGKHYIPDLMADEAVQWLRDHAGPDAAAAKNTKNTKPDDKAGDANTAESKIQNPKSKIDRPFFLYFASPLPHLGLHAPAELVEHYRKKIPNDPPYDGGKGYFPCAHPRATYAAMVTRLDQHVGRIVATLKELGLLDDTLILFASDNGPTFVIGGADSKFFDAAQGRRGLKEEVYEGGIRVPLIARWRPAAGGAPAGGIASGATSDVVTVLYDLFPTFAEVSAAPLSAAEVKALDGVSLVPTLTGRPTDQPLPAYRYWEIHAKGGRQALRQGDWKLVRNNVRRDPAGRAYELYDLSKDPTEQHDLAAANPQKLKELTALIQSARTESPVKGWNFEPAKPSPAAAAAEKGD
jgi:arylsulfatase A-like enzyme